MCKNPCVIAGVMCGVVVAAVGCILPAMEGGKALLLAFEGDYEEIEAVAPEAVSPYRGFRVGALAVCSIDELPKLKEDEEYEFEMAHKIVEQLPDRLSHFMIEDAKLEPGASPAVTVSVEDVRVTKRTGLGGVALPKVEVWARVTLSDASRGEVLGVAEVHGDTGSRIIANPMQLASIISRGTAKWINDCRKRKKRD